MRLPDVKQLFLQRAERFRQLASKRSSIAGYLSLMAELAQAQHSTLDGFPLVTFPDETHVKLSLEHRLPPLNSVSWPRDPAWQEALRQIIDRFKPQEAPVAAILNKLKAASADELENWADRLLAWDFAAVDVGSAPFLAAALQIYWTAMIGRLDSRGLAQLEQQNRCPVCGSHPVASILETGGAIQGRRYLCCSLCASEWNLGRIQCGNCGASQGIAYYEVDGMGEAVKAESCDACKTYLKVMNREKDIRVEAFADDLGSVTLDLLMAEAGFQRFGINPLLIPVG